MRAYAKKNPEAILRVNGNDPIPAGYTADPPPAAIAGHRREHIDGAWQQVPLPVNINSADAETLAACLSGAGASLAQQIIDGRPWENPADLAQIGGISENMVEAWMDDPGLET